jgi:hypothetical protein
MYSKALSPTTEEKILWNQYSELFAVLARISRSISSLRWLSM